MKTSRAFTLIELLIVIAIIGILMALLFPAVNSALDAARRAQAKNDVVQIATAVTAYETEYGKLPPVSSGSVDSALVAILTGVEGNTDNPREIVFLEVGEAKRGKSGTNGSGFVDPWAISEDNASSTYKIAVDDDYDNSITAGDPSETLRKKVAVWNDTTNKRHYVKSWE